MEHNEERVAALLTDVKNGVHTAFAELLSMYHPLLQSRISCFNPSESERKELYQEATLALYRAACSYHAGRGVTFGAFARVCIANALISAYRKSRATTEVWSLDQLREEGSAPPAEGEDVAHRLISQEEVAELCRVARATLSKYEMQVFVPYINGYTPRQIAESLGRGEKSVANAIGRAMAKLRTQLQ